MAKKRIFVSCGQETEPEITLGRKIIDVINRYEGMEGFFAQDVHSPEDLNRAVFGALKTCDGFFAVLHQRGIITYGKYARTKRSSVWIQQEIAILCYRMFLQSSHVPIRVYIEKGILSEGVMKTAIVNPISFETKEEVLTGLAQWLNSPEFEEHPVRARRESLFRKKTRDLGAPHWLILELIAAHSINPEDMVSYEVIQNDFLDIEKEIAATRNRADSLGSFMHAFRILRRAGLINELSNSHPRRIGIAKQWWDLVLQDLRNEGRIT